MGPPEAEHSTGSDVRVPATRMALLLSQSAGQIYRADCLMYSGFAVPMKGEREQHSRPSSNVRGRTWQTGPAHLELLVVVVDCLGEWRLAQRADQRLPWIENVLACAVQIQLLAALARIAVLNRVSK